MLIHELAWVAYGGGSVKTSSTPFQSSLYVLVSYSMIIEYASLHSRRHAESGRRNGLELLGGQATVGTPAVGLMGMLTWLWEP